MHPSLNQMKVLIAYEPGVHFTLGASFAQAHRLSRPSGKDVSTPPILGRQTHRKDAEGLEKVLKLLAAYPETDPEAHVGSQSRGL